jgi:hypothetical protein
VVLINDKFHYMKVCYINCCVDGVIILFIKLYTQQDAYSKV